MELTSELDSSLTSVFFEAQAARHSHLLAEHLLVALIDEPTSRDVLRWCRVDDQKLRGDLWAYLEANAEHVPGTHAVEPEGSLKFQRTIQRAMRERLELRTEDRRVRGADVLRALFGERDCHAVSMLLELGVTRQRVLYAQSAREGWKDVGEQQ
jgi:ATP-dependent Clp protease ATP-binding subunit ClpA